MMIIDVIHSHRLAVKYRSAMNDIYISQSLTGKLPNSYEKRRTNGKQQFKGYFPNRGVDPNPNPSRRHT